MDILRYRNGILGDGVEYVGRPKGSNVFGLGNPFGLKGSRAKWVVESIHLVISSYRAWLKKLLWHWRECMVELLTDFEREYLQSVLTLARRINDGEVTALVCWCINQRNYQINDDPERCHAEALYKACLWINTIPYSEAG